MGKYFVLQVKRMLRLIPLMVLVGALLLCGFFLAYRGIVSKWGQENSFQKLKIGLVGTADDPLLEAALEAAKSLDATQMSIDFVQMQEVQAVSGLERGELSAYLVFPEQFLKSALQGEIVPIRFVSSAGSENIISLVKDELASVFANMLLTSEQGAFALENALKDYDKGEIAGEKMNELALSYAKMIFNRDEVYAVEELGISFGLSFSEYMTCGLSVLLGFLLTLSFALVLVRDSYALEQLLKSRGFGAGSQVICELGAFVLCLAPFLVVPTWIFADQLFLDTLQTIPAIFCVAAMSYFLYSLCSDLLSAVLLQLFTVLAMCFVSGCMYPTHFFPISVQKLSSFLPAAMVKNHLASIWYGEPSGSFWLLLFSGLLFTLCSILIRSVRITGKKGAGL